MKPMPSSRYLLTMLASAAALVACGPSGGDDTTECEGAFLTGDLVITEIMANPDGVDEGKEWFEIYNATAGTVDLTGLTLAAAKEDGTSEKVHFMSEAIIDAGGYYVVGGVLGEFKPPYMNYGYASDLGSLNNTAGKLALRCNTTVVDEVIYGTMDSGEAQGLDGSSTPDHTANDNLMNWCASSNEFETGQFGTPGTVNDACSVVAPTTCLDNGVEREVVSPVAGEVVITEVMANPSGADGDKEWFEVLVTAEVDVNGLNFGDTPGDPEGGLASTDCIRVTAGTYMVFAGSDVMAMNGGLPAVDGTFDFTLTNTSDTLFVGVGATVLDEVMWTSAPDGKSLSLDPSKTNPTDNDDTGFWCTPGATNTYGDGDEGTPGMANPDCDFPPPPGMCYEGETLRAVVKPVAGDLVITEVMPDPSAVGDTVGEYFEIRANADVDLNGLEMGQTAPSVSNTFNPSECVRLMMDDYAVFARSDVFENNGMIPGVVGTTGFSLTNDPGSMFIGIDGTTLDSTSWSTSPSGASLALNEITMVWCETSTDETYGAGDHGTPGAVNTIINLICP